MFTETALFSLHSPVKLRFDPEQIPRKRFIVVFGSITCKEQHTKSSPK